MLLTVKNPRRAEIFLAQGRFDASRVREMTGADVVINGGLYDMKTQSANCHLRVSGVDFASDVYNYVYGYGWHTGKADLTPVESRNKAIYDNFICCSWMITNGGPVEMVYAPDTGGRRGNTAIGRLKDGSIVVDVHRDVDGEKITPEELRTELIAYGCVDAMRLDGGGSSQLSADKYERKSPIGRKVHNYICIWGDIDKPKEDKPMKIYLSPSSQPANLYSAGSTNEQVQCRRIADYCKTALERCGFEVKVGEAAPDYAGRTAESNAWGADIHVPIHTNAGGGHGVRVFVYSNTTARLALAQPVYDAINAIALHKSTSGVTANPGLHEVKNSSGKCVYVECAFHDNKEEAQWIIDHVTELGEAICEGLCKGTGVKYIPPVIEPEAPVDYAAIACGKAVAKGIFLGDGKGNYGWRDGVTRQDLCVVLDRLGLL